MEIPGYKINRVLGKGGMATVFLATQKSLGRSVVLKITNTEKEHSDVTENEDSDVIIGRFINEGRIIASLVHPHIITIFDIGTYNNLLYISMEYVNGGDLKQKIAQTVPPEQALDILIRIGGSLDYAHSKGIIHRDVKPANILFRHDGTPLLTDFGIAKQTQSDLELTSVGLVVGSPHYMSPEQAEGTTLDGRSDIYGLGIIFFEMLTGAKPYEGDSALKIVMNLQLIR